MADPFTIRIFVADGDPEGVRIVDRMNWTGVGIVLPRDRWAQVRSRQEFSRTGVYILSGFREGDNEVPTIYVGEGDAVRDRIDAHEKTKDFWEKAFVFTTSNNGLNKAHVRWLERELIDAAKTAGRCRLDNGTAPAEPPLTEADRADNRAFLREILQVLPIVGLQAFEKQKAIAVPAASPAAIAAASPISVTSDDDSLVVVVPAQEDGFRQVFLGMDRWRAIRISGGKLHKIRYIAAYQTKPISAVTYLAKVAFIEPYGEGGKYQLVFAEAAAKIGPVPLGEDATPGLMQGPRYTTLGALKSAQTLAELFPPKDQPDDSE